MALRYVPAIGIRRVPRTDAIFSTAAVDTNVDRPLE